MRQYTSKTYPVECFVDKATFEKFGLKCWEFIDPDIIWTADALTKFYGKKILMNNWKDCGQIQYRVFRPAGCGTGAPYSAHYRGDALDFSVPGIAAAQVQIDIKNNPELWPAITRMEDITATPTWTHLDKANRLTETPGVYIFKP